MADSLEEVHLHHGAKPVYGHVDGKAGIDKIFSKIRSNIRSARSRKAMTELYRRAGYLITLTYARSWEARFGERVASVRAEAEADFRKLVRQLNSHAEAIGETGDYDENWVKVKH